MSIPRWQIPSSAEKCNGRCFPTRLEFTKLGAVETLQKISKALKKDRQTVRQRRKTKKNGFRTITKNINKKNHRRKNGGRKNKRVINKQRNRTFLKTRSRGVFVRGVRWQLQFAKSLVLEIGAGLGRSGRVFRGKMSRGGKVARGFFVFAGDRGVTYLIKGMKRGPLARKWRRTSTWFAKCTGFTKRRAKIRSNPARSRAQLVGHFLSAAFANSDWPVQKPRRE